MLRSAATMRERGAVQKAARSIACTVLLLASGHWGCKSTSRETKSPDSSPDAHTVITSEESRAAQSVKAARAAAARQDNATARSIVSDALAEMSLRDSQANRRAFELEMSELGTVALEIGALEQARSAWEQVAASRASVLPEGAVELVAARVQLAKCLCLLEKYT